MQSSCHFWNVPWKFRSRSVSSTFRESHWISRWLQRSSALEMRVRLKTPRTTHGSIAANFLHQIGLVSHKISHSLFVHVGIAKVVTHVITKQYDVSWHTDL
ncbi:hypothetical protein AVEN_93677-1 [Araneus ventricosus]|uniref:Uncharacterized protein n=1 Tax=Araneus ventricosus TaxID=182803 RepID=A0A4Y2RW11_ARAVE|nr:hypothetical protein AVEN_93677-1 [Araneus ventricosus]